MKGQLPSQEITFHLKIFLLFIKGKIISFFNFLQYLLLFDGEKKLSLYNYKADPYLNKDLKMENPTKKKKMEAKLKAAIQWHHQNMVENEWTMPSVRPN